MLIVPFLTGITSGGRRLLRRPQDVRRPDLRVVVAPIVGAIALIVMSSAWIASGGVLHGRYVFPVLAPLAVAAAFGCEAAGRARVAGSVVLVGLAGATTTAFWLLDASVRWVETSPLSALPSVMAHPWSVAFACCSLAGLALLSLLRCYVHTSRRSRRSPGDGIRDADSVR